MVLTFSEFSGMGSGFQALSHSLKGLHKATATVFYMMTAKRSGLSLSRSRSVCVRVRVRVCVCVCVCWSVSLSVCLSVCVLYDDGEEHEWPRSFFLSLARSLSPSRTLTHLLAHARAHTLAPSLSLPSSQPAMVSRCICKNKWGGKCAGR